MTRVGNHYHLDSGRVIHAYAGVLGLCQVTDASGNPEDFKTATLVDGYDGYADGSKAKYAMETNLTPAERTEIAAFMIKQWEEWADL